MLYFRFAARVLRKHKGPYLLAAAILALGIGMSVAMFSLVDAVLLKPLPFPHQEAIHLIWKSDFQTGNQVGELAYPELRDLEQSIRDFESVALLPTSLYGYAKVLRIGASEPVQIESTPVSHEFFRVLGVSPVLGRDFLPADERTGASPTVILSDRVWREQFAADPLVIGRVVSLNGAGSMVIGVMGPGVEFPRGAGMWVPLGVDARVIERRGNTFLQAIARAKAGVTREHISEQVRALFKRQVLDYPKTYSPSQDAAVMPLVEYWTGSARQHLWMMLAASLLLLIASIVSAGNLLLSRTLSREGEIATRLAVGAGGSQILAQLAAEGALVALVAVIGGLGLAESAIRIVVVSAPADIPRLTETALDVNSFFFAAAAAAIAAVGCAVFSGLPATRVRVESALRESGARTSLSKRGGRIKSAFILAQTAVTVMLVTMASLLLLSYRATMSANVGFANRDAISMNLALRVPGQSPDINTRRLFYTRLLNRLREAPGVASAAAILTRPLEGPIGWDVSYDVRKEAAQVLPKANYEVVTPDYFKTVGTKILEGRDFDEHDAPSAEPVAIVSQALAQKIRAEGYSPLGFRLKIGLGAPEGNKIVGIVENARYRNITQTGPDLFVPYSQALQPTNYVLLRGERSAQELTTLVRHALAEIDPAQAIAGVATVGELIDRNTARHRFNMTLLAWFGVCSVILAAMGTYSVIAEGVVVRQREIAIKTVLGARKHLLVRQIVLRSLVFVLAGEAIGLGSMVSAGNLGADLLYGVSPRDPGLLAVVAGSLLIVSLAAALVPAWSAAGRDPNTSLREV